MDRKHLTGFTLLELLVTLAILSVVLFISMASFIDLIRANQLATQVNFFIAATNLARNEAITRSQRVFICARAGNVCSGASSWENGWIVFSDEDGDSVVSKGEVMRYFEALQPGYVLRPNIGTTHLIYYGDGHVRRNGGMLPLVTFRLCAPDAAPGTIAERVREVVIGAAGRVRLQPGREGKTICP